MDVFFIFACNVAYYSLGSYKKKILGPKLKTNTFWFDGLSPTEIGRVPIFRLFSLLLYRFGYILDYLIRNLTEFFEFVIKKNRNLKIE